MLLRNQWGPSQSPTLQVGKARLAEQRAPPPLRSLTGLCRALLPAGQTPGPTKLTQGGQRWGRPRPGPGPVAASSRLPTIIQCPMQVLVSVFTEFGFFFLFVFLRVPGFSPSPGPVPLGLCDPACGRQGTGQRPPGSGAGESWPEPITRSHAAPQCHPGTPVRPPPALPLWALAQGRWPGSRRERGRPAAVSADGHHLGRRCGRAGSCRGGPGSPSPTRLAQCPPAPRGGGEARLGCGPGQAGSRGEPGPAPAPPRPWQHGSPALPGCVAAPGPLPSSVGSPLCQPPDALPGPGHPQVVTRILPWELPVLGPAQHKEA